LALKSFINGKYIHIGKNEKSHLYANSEIKQISEAFEVTSLSETQRRPGENETLIALKSMKSGKYLSARDTKKFRLTADAASIGDTEKFYVFYGHSNSVGLKSKASGKFLCSNPDEDKPLIIDRDHFLEWEMFEIVPY
jgi:hypothetical protein